MIAPRYVKGSWELYEAGEAGVVAPWADGVVFRCPCGERHVYVASPPHVITFAGDGALTLDGSCGYKARPSLGRPSNWCHFNISDGVVKMHGDAACPGGKG